jgi:hypothetical protein
MIAAVLSALALLLRWPARTSKFDAGTGFRFATLAALAGTP